MENNSLLSTIAAATAGNMPEIDSNAVTADQIRAAFPVAHAAIVAAATNAERTRILAIQGAVLPGQEALARAAIDEGSSPGDAALRMVTAHRQALDSRLTAIRAADSLAAVPAAPQATREASPEPVAVPAARKTKEQLMADWQSSAALQSDFVSAGDYAAFELNKHRTKVIGQKL